MSKNAQRLAVEEMMYNLKTWTIDQLDNENVSDGLYGFVKDMLADVKRELRELEQEIILG